MASVATTHAADENESDSADNPPKRVHASVSLAKHPFKQPASKYDFVKVISCSHFV
jgi:hypothetical protein